MEDVESVGEPTPGTVSPESIRLTVNVQAATPAVRSYYSSFFLAAAADSARAAAESEVLILKQGRRLSLAHRGQVLSAIIHSVSFIEAAINEILEDAAEGRISVKTLDVDPATIKGWAALWIALERGYSGNALRRYQSALIIDGQEPFNVGAEPWQSAQVLVRVRNHLVHFRPETVSPSEPQRLADALKAKVDPNPLPGNAWDLDGWLSASCATWAVNSALALVESFAERTKAVPNYQTALPELRRSNP